MSPACPVLGRRCNQSGWGDVARIAYPIHRKLAIALLPLVFAYVRKQSMFELEHEVERDLLEHKIEEDIRLLSKESATIDVYALALSYADQFQSIPMDNIVERIMLEMMLSKFERAGRRISSTVCLH